jgi:hypothetical protein
VSSGLEEAGERFKHRIEETVPLAYLEGIEGAGSISLLIPRPTCHIYTRSLGIMSPMLYKYVADAISREYICSYLHLLISSCSCDLPKNFL